VYRICKIREHLVELERVYERTIIQK